MRMLAPVFPQGVMERVRITNPYKINAVVNFEVCEDTAASHSPCIACSSI